MTDLAGIPQHSSTAPKTRVDMGSTERAALGGSGALADSELKKANAAVEAAIAEAAQAANPRAATTADDGPAVDPGEPGPPRSRPLREPLRGRRDPARRGRGRHHQHGGGVGDADHVPDPSRVRRPAGHRQRLQHDRPGARVGLRRDRLPPGAGRSAAAGDAPGQRVADRRHRRRRTPAGAAGRRLRRHRAGADPARLRAGGAAAADLGRGRPAPRGFRRAAAHVAPGGCGRGCWSPACTAATSARPRACC